MPENARDYIQTRMLTPDRTDPRHFSGWVRETRRSHSKFGDNAKSGYLFLDTVTPRIGRQSRLRLAMVAEQLDVVSEIRPQSSLVETSKCMARLNNDRLDLLAN